VKPEAAQYLDKARQALKEARAVAVIELAEATGRAAYLAAFHAAQALILDRWPSQILIAHGLCPNPAGLSGEN
jgi:uncharacterized protein (UPF0332 family)